MRLVHANSSGLTTFQAKNAVVHVKTFGLTALRGYNAVSPAKIHRTRVLNMGWKQR